MIHLADQAAATPDLLTVIVAVATAIVAILEWRGKRDKAAKLNAVVDAIEAVKAKDPVSARAVTNEIKATAGERLSPKLDAEVQRSKTRRLAP